MGVVEIACAFFLGGGEQGEGGVGGRFKCRKMESPSKEESLYK